MTRFSFLFITLATLGAFGCGDDSTGADGDGSPVPSGQALYEEPHVDGNSFACATCHALSEPTSDGVRRPGHPIGDAAVRDTYKNGQLTSFLAAVNTCRVEWMAAPEFTDDDERWLALFEFLADEAAGAPSSSLSYEIVEPPAALDGGDPMVGQEIFNETCVVCHGVDAEGTERGPTLVGSSLSAELVARRVRTSGTVNSSVYQGLTGGRMPFWAADRLSDEELLDVIAFVLGNDGSVGGGGEGGMEGLRECPSTHPSIGQTATLVQFSHDVGGTARIIDDCTIQIDDFTFDGLGIDVRFYGGLDGDYDNGFSMSEEDLRRPGGYNGETVFAQLPEGRTLNDLNGISVWCVPVAQTFGDGLFN
ncbi:MAG: DM13 domain-containing protein [Myxococcota bacterium]